MTDDLITIAYSIPDILIPEFVLWTIGDQQRDADALARQKWAEPWQEGERVKKAAAALHLPDNFETLAFFPVISQQHLYFLQNSCWKYTLPFWSDYWRSLQLMGLGDPNFPILVDCEIVSPDGGEVQYQERGAGLVPLPIGTLTVTLRLRWGFLFARHYYGHLREAIPQRWPQATLTHPRPLSEEPKIMPEHPKTAPTPNARKQESAWLPWFNYYHDLKNLGYGLTWQYITDEINKISGATYSVRTVRNNHLLMCACRHS